MSQFECNIKDLIDSDTTKENIQDDVYEEPIKEEITIDQQKPQEIKPKISNNVKPHQKGNVNEKNKVYNVILNDVKDKKNHKIFMVIICMYLLLNSQPIYKLIHDMFPYLMESVTQVNIKGQIIIAILISIGVIVSKSSLFVI
tara:strand:- start:21422 stop:21850 length:429 start_codon:yes stop_codon:yes gene_type:complete